jgi:TolB protein
MLGRPDANPGQAKEIYISDYDGANQQRFTANQSINIHPVWSPTGGLIAFSSYVSGVPDIYVANWAQPGRALTRPAAGNDRAQDFCPAWSPDGTKIAFMSNRSGDMEIWVVNGDGTGLMNLTNSPRSYETTPTWSPTGAQIAFVSDRSGQPQIYWMNANGTGVEKLTSERGDRPTWSPLGFIAFTAGQAPGSDIAIFDIATRRSRILTDGLGTNGSPAVSPNGRHIAFVTTRWGKEQIAVIDQDGKNVRRITEAGNNTYPNWQPISGSR